VVQTYGAVKICTMQRGSNMVVSPENFKQCFEILAIAQFERLIGG